MSGGGGQLEHVTYRHALLGITSPSWLCAGGTGIGKGGFRISSNAWHMTRLHDSAVGEVVTFPCASLAFLRFGWTGGLVRKEEAGQTALLWPCCFFREDFYYAAAPPNVRLNREHCFLDPKGFPSCEQF